MKKILLTLASVLLCSELLSQTDIRLFGDFNNDGAITAADVTYLVGIATGENTPVMVIGGDVCEEVKVSSLSFDKQEISIPVKATAELTVSLLPENATNKNITLESNDESVVSICGDKLTGVSIGSATVSAYTTDGSNISCSCEVHIIDAPDPFNGHEYVDMGIKDETGNSVMWATCNVGACEKYEFGNYYAWGEVETKQYFYWTNYKWYDGTYYVLQKYCDNPNEGFVDYIEYLESEDDVASVHWGGRWQIPTDVHFKILLENSTSEWTEYSSVEGLMITSNVNGNSIFLPAAGTYREYDFLSNTGQYWTNRSSTHYAYHLSFDKKYTTIKSYWKYYGKSVRPVCVVSAD